MFQYLKYLRKIKHLQAYSNIVNQFLKRKPPDALVLIDYMGPNIRLGNKVKKVAQIIKVNIRNKTKKEVLEGINVKLLYEEFGNSSYCFF